tara:strand:+ start:2251 stop:2514 length:264 start_codon:yes stop_codon:yes gene_type:complete
VQKQNVHFMAWKRAVFGHCFYKVDKGVDKGVDIVVQKNMCNNNNLTRGGQRGGQDTKRNVHFLMTMDRRTSVYKEHLSPSHAFFDLI